MATVKSGFLQKLSGFLKRDWKRQYFVLHQDGQLIYCDRVGEEHINGRQVNIKHGCHRIDYGYEVEASAQNKCGGRVACLFSINTTEKTIVLLADSEQDARDWVQSLKGIHQNFMVMGTYGQPVQQMVPPSMAYPGIQSGMGYPNNQPGIPYPGNHAGMPYPNNQSGMPYPSSQSGMPYPSNQVGIPYPSNQPGIPYPTSQPGPYPVNQPMYCNSQPGMPYTTGTAYPTQQYNQPVMTGPYQAQPYQTAPQYYQQAGGYPVYQQQQVQQNRSGMSSRRGLLAGAAGGALAGGLLGFGMGRAVGGFGSFDSCDSDFGDGCDFGGCD